MKTTIKNFVVLLALVSAFTTVAQKKKQKQDAKSILEMCGCYDISFNFAETFGAEKDYDFHPNYLSGGLEWIFPVEEEDGKIVLQHLLVIGDSMIIKHWRQDWEYQNTEFYEYDKNSTWKYIAKSSGEVKGQWTQRVFQVDDSPRYESTGSWVHVDGRHYWEAVADSPLPRRELTKRDDYNVMIRRNRHEITEYGWLHEQDNQKVIRDAGDKLLASEKGWNTYTKVEESQCQLAVDWWSKNQAYWADVRAVWDEVFASNATLELRIRNSNGMMFMRLSGLGDELAGENYSSEAAIPQIKEIIQSHIKSDIKLAME